ncbi:MAG: hypothetical protein MK226_17880 [Saprospiraceae bacterium]|jgi:hypothetical protein|nr:hypothetical protein [Saprospiraceae bacterium]
MEKLKSYILATLLLFVGILSFAQQAEKTLVKTFNLHGNNVVRLDMNGPVEVRTWKNPTMRVQMTISSENGSNALLKSLVQSGRYNLRSTQGEEGLVINAPAFKREVKLGKTLIQENLSFVIYAPENTSVRWSNEASTDYSTDDAL